MSKQNRTNELTGTIVAAHGRHYLADVDGEFLQCVTRGKKTNVAVGDIVHLKRTSNDQAVIEKIAERTTLLYRSDQYKSKLLAANISRLFIVIATEPSFADDLVSRALVACEAAGVDAHLILNKVDLEPNLARARERASLYTSLGYPLHEVSAKTHPDETVATLTPLLQDHSSILIGQSGMGKSSIVNLLVPDADIAVREISEALDTGKHTTTFTRLYKLPAGGTLIDSPGFQEFGLNHIEPMQLAGCMPDLKAHLGDCKFYNCTHLHEPGCGVLAAVGSDAASGGITPSRYRIYKELFAELSQPERF
jgi:ribosome biogenesis GTPase / thiamine phosphate phosphatase